MMKTKSLEQLAEVRKIKVHEPFAEFLKAEPAMHSFEISLLDCYRMAGHACYAMTGAFLVTEAAVIKLFPETGVCERGDVKVEFGSQLNELATGPRSNVITFITGAWADTGFAGLKGNFIRKNLVSFGHSELSKTAVKFSRVSNQQSVVVDYDPSIATSRLKHELDFPDKWRVEICEILEKSNEVIKI